jgi:hypothetical protein
MVRTSFPECRSVWTTLVMRPEGWSCRLPAYNATTASPATHPSLKQNRIEMFIPSIIEIGRQEASFVFCPGDAEDLFKPNGIISL